MKKLTAFFMALLPIFVMVLLFAAGIIVKNSTHVYVQSVEISANTQEVLKPDDTVDQNFQLKAQVLPMNATVPDIIWTTSDDKILQVNDQGLVTCKDYGKAYVYAVSKENQTLSAACEVEVYDTKIHDVLVSNEELYNLSYVGINTKTKIHTTTKPATHIQNPTLKYEPADEESKNILQIAGDGTILPKKQGTAKVNIYPETDPSRIKQIPVTIGLGIDEIDVKEKTTAVTTESLYDVYSDIVIYPDLKENSIKRTDFIYETDDNENVTINANGIARFKKPGQATFTATYKRDQSKKANKTVYSSCLYFADVKFDSDSYQQIIEWDNANNKYKDVELTNLHCEAFPKAQSLYDKLSIQSSDPSVLEVVKDQESYSYKFVAHKPGTATLLAEVLTGPNMGDVVRDGCLVTIIPKTGEENKLIKQAEITLADGQFYYPLRNNINLDINTKYSKDITFDIDSGDATIESNEIINFPAAGTSVVNVYYDGGSTPIGTMKITVPDTASVNKIDVSDTVVLEAGKRYQFNNATPVWTYRVLLVEHEKWYTKFFNHDDSTNYFIPKSGASIDDFEVKLQDGTSKTIKVTVKEDPLYIKTNIDPAYVTAEAEISNFNDYASLEIVPSTSTKQDGSKYSIKNSYDPENNDVASIDAEKNSITFKQPGIVWIKSSIEGKCKITTQLKSTYGTLGKFNLMHDSKKVISNQLIEYTNQPLVFSVFDLSRSEANQIDAQSFTKTQLFDIKKEIISETILGTIKEVRFTLTPKTTDVSGIETIVFNTKTHNIYVNLKINPQITDIKLSYNNEILKSSEQGENLSFINGMEINVLPLPITTLDKTKFPFDIYLDDVANPLEVKDSKISLNNLANGLHTLKAKWTKDGQETTKIWNINVTNDFTQLKVTLSGVDKDNNLYLESNQTQKTMYLKANGFVAKNFFETNDFTAEINGETEKFGKPIFTLDTLTISDIPSPKDMQIYSEKLTLKYKGTPITGCEFNLIRDVVSRIKLPNHNNDDMTDKKGMQKVHVYGDKSYYKQYGGFVEFYALPIDLYDYKYEKIEDADAKKAAFDTLTYSFSDNKSTLEYKNGMLQVHFNPNSRYTEKEIFDNAFDSKINKNVTFNIKTKTQAATAQYTFVVVDGCNVYDQEGVLFWHDRPEVRHEFVLQTNFGGNSGVQFDDTRLDVYGVIYGNGYSMHFDKIFPGVQKETPRYLYVQSAINVSISGFVDEEYSWQVDNNINITLGENLFKDDHHIAYCIVKNFKNGFNPQTATEKNFYFKNCLFYNFLNAAFNTNGEEHEKTSFYFENCILFNAGCFSIWAGLNNPLSKCDINFKGDFMLYNFHNKDMLQHFFGTDISMFAWEPLLAVAKAKGMVQNGADGRPYINSFMLTYLNDGIYFWNGTEYEKRTSGCEATGKYLSKCIDLKLPLKNIEFSIWSTTSPDITPNAPNYYDEFDKDGNLRLDFMNNQIDKISRVPIYF